MCVHVCVNVMCTCVCVGCVYVRECMCVMQCSGQHLRLWSFVNSIYFIYCSPAQLQALRELFNSSTPDYYTGLKTIFGSLAWTQKQKDDLQMIQTNAISYAICDARNGVCTLLLCYFCIYIFSSVQSMSGAVSPAIQVKCPYTDQATCGSSSMNIPVLGSFVMTIMAILTRM